METQRDRDNYVRDRDLMKPKIIELYKKYDKDFEQNSMKFLKEYLEYAIFYAPKMDGRKFTSEELIEFYGTQDYGGTHDEKGIGSIMNEEYYDNNDDFKKYRSIFEPTIYNNWKGSFHKRIWGFDKGADLKKYLTDKLEKKRLEDQWMYYKKIFLIIVFILGVVFSIYLIIHIIFIIINIIKVYKGKHITKNKFILFLKIMSGPFSYIFKL